MSIGRGPARLVLLAAVLLLAAAGVRAQEDEDEASCPDFGRMAAQLRNGADNCDNAVANRDMRTCRVEIDFALKDVPGVTGAPDEPPWYVSPAAARDLAAKIDAVRCVQDFTLTTDPPGPLKPGTPFDLVATVTMANGANPEGVVVNLESEAQAPAVAAQGGADGGKGKAGRKSAAPVPQSLVIGADGVGRFSGAMLRNPLPAFVVGTVVQGLASGKMKKWIAPVFIPAGKCALAPKEEVIDRFYDQTRLSPGFLDLHEGVRPDPGKGFKDVAHTKRKHVPPFKDFKTTEAYLRSRGGRASAYEDQATAEAAIRESVTGSMANRAMIAAWLYFDGSFPQGLNVHYSNGYRKRLGWGVAGKKTPLTALYGRALSVLILESSSCKILIYTSYPELPVP